MIRPNVRISASRLARRGRSPRSARCRSASRARKSWGQVSANYVLSHSQSDDDNERDSGGPGAANTFDLAPEWGDARMDRRHLFNGYVLFYLTWPFDITSSFRFLSGRPIE